MKNIKKYIAGLLVALTMFSCIGCASTTKTTENTLSLREQREILFCESIGTTKEEFEALWEAEGFEEDFYIGAIEVFLEGLELSEEDYGLLIKEDTDAVYAELSAVFVGNVDISEEELELIENFISYKAILLLLVLRCALLLYVPHYIFYFLCC